MKYVILADGTRIDNCSDSTTSNEIFAIRNSFANAGAVRDFITEENVAVVTVYNDKNEKVAEGSDLVIDGNTSLYGEEENITCQIRTRMKTNEEKMQDQIAELQKAILG